MTPQTAWLESTCDSYCWLCGLTVSTFVCRERGDPALPFHYIPVVAALRKAVATAAAEQDFLTAIKLRLKAAVIAGQEQETEHCSRCLRGVAQVGHSLCSANQGCQCS